MIFRTATWTLAVLLLALSACSKQTIEGDPLSLESARSARGSRTLLSIIPWATTDRPAPTSLETEAEDGMFLTIYEVLEGEHAGERLLQIRSLGHEPGAWRLTRRLTSKTEPLEMRYQTIESGALMLSYSLNHERGVRVEMDPAALTLPELLEPGKTITREMKLRLPLLDNPKRLREKGTGISEITYVDDQAVQTAAGRFDAAHVREVFTSRFSAATAERIIDRWFAPGAGLIAERWTEEVRVLGVVIEQNGMTIRVLPPGSAEPALTTDSAAARASPNDR